MAGYMDKTWCDYWEKCKDGKDCHRALTPEVEKKAREWWGKKPYPVDLFFSEPKCFKEEK